MGHARPDRVDARRARELSPIAAPDGLVPIGRVVSPIADRADAPKQGSAAPDAWIVLDPGMTGAAADLAVGQELVVLTWLHLADRDVLQVRPRGDGDQPLTGVFSTRSPDRPNPIGLHQVRVLELDGDRIRVAGLEAVDATPVVDLKPVLPAPGVAGPTRDRQRRIADARARLDRDVDAWVATAEPGTGAPYLVPLSLLWDGEVVWLATAAASPTARNLLAQPRVRLGLGHTRDVVLVEGEARPVATADVDAAFGDAFAAKTGFDPRELAGEYLYFAVRPDRIQAWREVDELGGRDLMRDGAWLT